MTPLEIWGLFVAVLAVVIAIATYYLTIVNKRMNEMKILPNLAHNLIVLRPDADFGTLNIKNVGGTTAKDIKIYCEFEFMKNKYFGLIAISPDYLESGDEKSVSQVLNSVLIDNNIFFKNHPIIEFEKPEIIMKLLYKDDNNKKYVIISSWRNMKERNSEWIKINDKKGYKFLYKKVQKEIRKSLWI